MRIFLTNLGKYNEGSLVGEWLELPAAEDEIEECLKKIGIDNSEYEEYFITDYEYSLFDIEEYDRLDKLNELAEKIEELGKIEKKIFEFLMDYHGNNAELAFKILDEQSYSYYTDVRSHEDLGYAVTEDWEIPEHLKNYIDYQAIGRDYTCSGWNIWNGLAVYIS